MIKLPVGCSSEDVLRVVRQWVELLAQEKYRDAYDLTFHDSFRDDGWTPEVVESLVANYGSCEPIHDGTNYRVTSLQSDLLSEHQDNRSDVNFFDAKNRHNFVGHVDFDLPLNGEWSDVTATFNILEIENARVLCLEDIHVL